MKQILSVRSNAYYTQEENIEKLELNPMLEIVIIHTEGKNYKVMKNNLASSPKIVETRMVVSPDLLQNLITDLQLHQKKLDGIRKNADQLNSLIKHITSGDEISS